MVPEADAYTLADLCDAADVTPRTVRYYVAQGLLVAPSGAGPGARYGAAHLARLRLIRRLQREHLPLADIRRRLAAITDDEAIVRSQEVSAPPSESALDYIRGALASRGMTKQVSSLSVPSASPALPLPAPAPAPAPGWTAVPTQVSSGDPSGIAETPAPYTAESAVSRSQWERISLDPDVELHVRRPLSRIQSRAVERLVDIARHLLREEQP